MVIEGEGPDSLADVIDYNKNKLAPLVQDPRAGDHWFDEVKGGFDTPLVRRGQARADGALRHDL